jgi:serine protease inhibitor
MHPSSAQLRAARQAGEAQGLLTSALFQHVATTAGGNVFLSPCSVGTALALALEGAKGETAIQLKHVIGYGPQHDQRDIHNDLVSLLTVVRPSISRSPKVCIFLNSPFGS